MTLHYRNMDSLLGGWKKLQFEFEIKDKTLRFSKKTVLDISQCQISYLGEIFDMFAVKFEERGKDKTRIYLIGCEQESLAIEIFETSKNQMQIQNTEEQDIAEDMMVVDDIITSLENSKDNKGVSVQSSNEPKAINNDYISKALLTIENGDFIKFPISNHHFTSPQENYDFSAENRFPLVFGLTYEWFRKNDEVESESERYLPNQKKLLLQTLKKLGRSLFSASAIMNLSLPVIVFDKKTLLQRGFEKFSSALHHFKHVNETFSDIDILETGLKYLLQSCSMGMEQLKPFNPILGETSQFWIEGCPFYIEQISHHPPISSFLFLGRNFKMYGNIEYSVQINLNSVGISNLGNFTITFPSLKKTLRMMMPFVLLEGLVGNRKMNLKNRAFVLLEESNLLADLNFEAGKEGFFKSLFGKKTSKDYFEVKV